MRRKLIIDGNAVYELDENCMLTKRIDRENDLEKGGEKDRKGTERKPKKRTE